MKLRADNLIKTYKKRTVVKGISVEVNQGEIVGLLGPNGAGKTTSFYMIVGLVKPNQGNIYLDDLNITDYPMYKRAQQGIGYLAQEASVFRKLSIEDNILSVLQLTNLSKEAQIAKMESLIEEFSLEHIRTNRGDLLSGGERRRTEIARALATDPKFILLDEPFAALDAFTRETMQQLVLDLWIEQNKSFFLITHDIEEALLLSNQLVLMTARSGKIVETLKLDFADRYKQGESIRAIKSDPKFIQLREQLFERLRVQKQAGHEVAV